MRSLGLTDLGRLDARAWPDVCAGLLADARPRLVCARLSGGALALGRYQRADAFLSPAGQAIAPVRRMTGGRAAALGEGTLAVALVQPYRGWVEDSGALPAARLLNRAVRGILDGLGRLGIGAYYFGRDFVSVEGGQAGLLGFDIAPSGAALVECVLAAEAHWWLPAEMDALPVRAPVRGVPGPRAVRLLEGVSSAGLLDAVGAGYAARFGIRTEMDARPVPRAAPPVAPPGLPGRSPLHAVPSGFVEAAARCESGRIVQASFGGELLADSAGLALLEASLRGASPDLASLAPRFNEVYRDPAHALLGVDDLEVLAAALIEACAAAER